MPLFVSVFFIVVLIGSLLAILTLFVAGVVSVWSAIPPPDIDDDDNHRGGDEGFTPDPWGPTGNSDPLEQHEDELICQ